MNIDEQVALLTQGTEYGDEGLKQAMSAELMERLAVSEREGRPLRVYCGYDPTSADLHLGHTITMRKLRQFQDLGHEVTFLIGSYTALVGDPSDRNRARPILNQEQVAENARTYAEQAFRLLDRKRTKIRYNGEWLAELSLLDLIRLGQNFTVQQFLARENFADRLDRGDPIFLHETFYSLMQGYDAVAMQTDVQVGGTDQLFNIVVAARKLQVALGQEPLVAVITGILPGTDGVQRMSKSTGNTIPILAAPEDMYGKIMSLPDFAMGPYMRLLTRWTPQEIADRESRTADGSLHPRDAKMGLAREIVAIYHGAESVAAAEEHFKSVFLEHGLPEDMAEVRLDGPTGLVDLMVSAGLTSSRSDARRLIQQSGVKLDGQTITEASALVGSPGVLQVGKRKFLRIHILSAGG